MNEYITAEQARNNVYEAQSMQGAYQKAETEEILAKILTASQVGRREILINKSDAVIVKRLKALGYSVTVTSDQRDGDCMTITW